MEGTAQRGPALRELHPLAVFAAVLAAIALLYAGSALLFAGSAALRDPERAIGLHPLVRFNAIYALLIAFTLAAHRTESRAAGREAAQLRSVVEASPAQWAAWTRRLRPSRRRLLVAIGLGALFGAGVHQVGLALGGQAPSPWRGHRVWMALLAPAVFATIGPMALRGLTRARVLFEMGRHARVSIVEREGLAPFASAGLRGAAYWFLGSSIASLLVLEATAWILVLGVNSLTIALGVASLLLPSRGVHERLREAKRAELRWVRGEIARARTALGRPAASPEVAALPALLAWEARVERTGEWPFDASTLLRFALFLAVPLVSWLGGALVERLVDAWVPG